MKMMKHAQIHRFSNRVAVAFDGEGETVYLNPDQAVNLAKALNDCAADILKNDFTNSTFSTVRLT